jgi:hypothetical protein
MTYTLTIFDIQDLSTPEWMLRYDPSASAPFTTLQGSEHSWVWDFISGSFLKDGEVLVNHTVEIEGD